MGDWFATVLFWRPLVALFVKKAALLPVMMPFASLDTVAGSRSGRGRCWCPRHRRIVGSRPKQPR